MTLHRCKKIESLIKNLSSTQMEELFKIFQKNKCQYTVNNNGVFLNLSWLSEDTLNDIERFITFCIESKDQLERYEAIYQNLNQDFLEIVSEKDIQEDEATIIDVSPEIKKVISKISSSMKFYLFKKKFSKNVIPVIQVHYKERLNKDIPLCVRVDA